MQGFKLIQKKLKETKIQDKTIDFLLKKVVSQFDEFCSIELFNDYKLTEHFEITKGTKLLNSNEQCDNYWFILNGTLHSFYEKENCILTKDILFPGVFFTNFVSLTTGLPSEYSVKAITDCTLLSITKNKYQFLKHNSTLFQEIEQTVLSLWFAYNSYRFNLLRLPSEERYILYQNNHPECFKEIPLTYLASFLNVTPKTISRIRSRIRTWKKSDKGNPLHILFEKYK